MKVQVNIDPLFLRVSETARALNMANASVYELLRKGELPFVKIGGKTRIPVVALHKFVKRAMKTRKTELDNGLATLDRGRARNSQ